MKKFRDRFIDDLGQAWRFWSVRLAALAGALAAAIVADPHILVKLVDHLPEDWRPTFAGIAAFLVFIIPTLTRVTKQGGGKDDA
jgi:hypothetical protein